MSHDFAKYRQAQGMPQRLRPPATRTTEQPPQHHWSWFLAGMLCGFLIIGIGYLGLVELDTGPSEPEASAETAAEQPRRPVIDYGFYEELARAEVTVELPPPPAATAAPAAAAQTSTAAPATTSPAAAEDELRYLLQAGSFQDRQDAENRRVKVLLLNMDANVVPGVVAGRTWHRVQVGPFQGRGQAEAARTILSENNIDSIPLLLR